MLPIPSNYWTSLKERLPQVCIDQIPIKEKDTKGVVIIGTMSEDTKRIFVLWQEARKENRKSEETKAWMDEDEQMQSWSLVGLDELVLKHLFAAQICSQFPKYFPRHESIFLRDGRVGYRTKSAEESDPPPVR